MAHLTARHKILAFLRRQRAASAWQIAAALQMKPASVRHHLAILSDDGRVRELHRQRPAKRGRPARIYALATHQRGDNLPGAIDALLGANTRGESLLRAAGIRLAGRVEPAGGLPRVLSETVQRLNKMHYEAGWEAGAAGPRLLFGNCPYAAVIEQHPELCLMDAALLEASLGIPVRQAAKIEEGGPPACIFLVGKPA